MVVNDSTGNLLSKSLASGFNDSPNVALVKGAPSSTLAPLTLLSKFLAAQREIESYQNGHRAVQVDGKTLSIAAVTAAARHVGVDVQLSNDSAVKERVVKSRAVITEKVEKGTSVYGLSTGFGGSADTRTDKPILLGHALLQHQHSGILPSSQEPPSILPLLDPGSSTTMPEAWTRGAMLIRMNSLVRGHSGVRWELIEKIGEILRANVVPAVPMRGSISASGDLSPLSYVAGLLVGNPSIRAFDGPAASGARKMVSSRVALAAHNIDPISLASKEQLGILNGTAFSASVASLALNDAVHLTLLAQVCTAMGTEALIGSRGSFAPFIHSVARPHPGQVECAQNIWNLLEGSKLAETHEEELSLEDDKYSLRQDRYPLRTSPQFLGPQIEDILSALSAVTQECNSTTDNPLVDGETGEIHHGGNFQAMSVSNAVEKTRLALHHIGKLLFAQTTELLNPAMNRGLPPSLAASDPSLNYFGKGVDIATAAYVSELGYLANPVSTHIQSAEMHNQAVNSLALISARATVNSLDVLTMLTSSYLYVLCQALDLRALQEEFVSGLCDILRQEFAASFETHLAQPQPKFVRDLCNILKATLERTSTMDAADQMREVASSSSTMLLNLFASPEFASSQGPVLVAIPGFQANLALRSATLLNKLRGEFLSGQRGACPASLYLGKTRPVYEFIRVKLGVKMHGAENYAHFANGLGVDDVTIGQNISVIYEAIRDGEMQKILAGLFD
ncbi:phenylalanine ammonia-lyase [Mycena rosella]|uniref:Phenylalanine ammonia-lyase n=1 Tax=Mycena rosella TaxID=1033263 RepID=A0AAD7E1M7_MYCRO|nr:phenylalanine ammonia-lyase [Mycena rosella]